MLPQLRERVDFLQTHLALGDPLSQGQQMLLEIILDSLQDPVHLTELLTYNNPDDIQRDQNSIIRLMHILVQSVQKNTVSMGCN